MQRSELTVARSVAALPSMATVPVRGAASSSSSVGAQVYQLVFRRNVTYATFIFGTAIVAEAVYGKVTDGFWNLMNNGVSGDDIRGSSSSPL